MIEKYVSSGTVVDCLVRSSGLFPPFSGLVKSVEGWAIITKISFEHFMLWFLLGVTNIYEKAFKKWLWQPR